MRRKLILGVTAVALAVPAPAFAIHDPNVPAGTDVGNKGCSASGSVAVGDPSVAAGRPDKPNTGFSNSVLIEHNNANPPCHNDPN
jgi:hypothetical protein